MGGAHGLRQVGYHDCPGGGQVVVDGRLAFVAHMKAPHGTTILDVADPSAPRVLATIAIPAGLHSHKVRAANGLMLVNREAQPADRPPDGAQGGLAIFDVSNPRAPREIAFWRCGGAGVHRFTFDGRHAYISPEMDGYVGNIVMILDLRDPARPEEVGRWWMPGQWIAGGETPAWRGRQHRCHHPIRLGQRLYVSYWHGGFVILDIEDMAKPRVVSGLDWSPPFITPTHTALPVPFPIRGRNILLVADEDVAKLRPGPPSFLWLVDITDETRPVPFASFQVAGVDGSPQPPFTGCHQPDEDVQGTEIPVAWFASGLRIVDIADPHAPREVAHFMPDVPPGEQRVCSNDVCHDDRGLLYLIDRGRGLHILERV
ncbi:MAG TPA: hypothetical protein VNN07_07405 [Candidatus Tectomicrobia bacterium]|nr:hypothetical protein [Candidatus Tectomicrobia bacterium]